MDGDEKITQGNPYLIASKKSDPAIMPGRFFYVIGLTFLELNNLYRISKISVRNR